MKASILVLFILLSYANSLYAKADISIAAEAVLGKLVVMQINGKREKMRVGETKHGINIIEANTNAVTVSVNGEARRIKVGSAAVRSAYSTSKKIEKIGRNLQGMYMTAGTINQQSANFLVDTGATFVALSPSHAKSFGIDAEKEGRLIQVSTANGTVPAYMVKLDSVSVGGITVEQVDGVVVTGQGMPEILLGMSFLNRIDVSYKNGVMTLESQ